MNETLPVRRFLGLKLTSATDYAIRAMIHLSCLPEGDVALRSEIARRPEHPNEFHGQDFCDSLVVPACAVISGVDGAFLARAAANHHAGYRRRGHQGPAGADQLHALARGARRRSVPASSIWAKVQDSMKDTLAGIDPGGPVSTPRRNGRVVGFGPLLECRHLAAVPADSGPSKTPGTRRPIVAAHHHRVRSTHRGQPGRGVSFGPQKTNPKRRLGTGSLCPDAALWCLRTQGTYRSCAARSRTMIIGVPRETHRHEHRVGLNPFGVSRLVQKATRVFVENRLRRGRPLHRPDYPEAGGQIVYSPEEAYKRADIVCRVGAALEDELDFLRPGSHRLRLPPPGRRPARDDPAADGTGNDADRLRDRPRRAGSRPILMPFSEMAGQMAVHIAAHYLQIEAGGRGILLGNVPGVPPPTVLILGAGDGRPSGRASGAATGAHVIVLDEDLRKLRALNREFAGQVVTVRGRRRNGSSATPPIADVVIGAVLVPGGRAPFLVTEEMVRTMKPGSVIIDLSIDQGGCVETSRPTTLESPTFKVHGVVHYCVPNMTANVPRTASRALANRRACPTSWRWPIAAWTRRCGRPRPGRGTSTCTSGKIVNERVARDSRTSRRPRSIGCSLEGERR